MSAGCPRPEGQPKSGAFQVHLIAPSAGEASAGARQLSQDGKKNGKLSASGVDMANPPRNTMVELYGNNIELLYMVMYTLKKYIL